jgi:O-glycosyl hydrolase
MTRHLGFRLLAAPAALALCAGLLASVAPAGEAAPVAPTGEDTVETVTIGIDPSYQQPMFEGWGTSLVWFANVTGGYPGPIRDRLVDMLFGKDGLRLNIARYNIGGGNAPDVREDYMKAGATMEGFWQAPPGTTHEDKEWWDPGNPAHWNWNADANQRWWIDQIKDEVTHWEAFSNSPPYFQTVSGYVSGGFNSSQDQIRADRVDEFATYLLKVSEHVEQAHGIQFDTIDPLNEPNTPYWGTQLGPDGQPTGGRQEGAHAGPQLQDATIQALRRALDTATQTNAVVSAPDETNPGTFVADWNGYTPQARAAVDQLNVHTYGTGQRTSARDVAKGADKKLWMSEVEGSWGTGTDYVGMEPGLGIATRMADDIRELEPSAWVFWQPVEDAIPMQAGNSNWGSIHIPFNCTASDTLETCPIRANTKFDTIRNFTHYIRPGDRFVRVNEPSTVAALRANGRAASVVHINNSGDPRDVTLDLSRFGRVSSRATVTPIVSSAAGGLVRGERVRVTDQSATLRVPAKSVTTFLVDGVSGVAKDAALVQASHVYRFQGVHSGRSLAPTADGAATVIRTTDPASTAQLWNVSKLTAGPSNRARYGVVNVATGKRLAMRDGALVLDDTADDDPAAQWVWSTTGDGTWTLVNAATGRLVDVSGQATADGSPVGTWTPTSGGNQRWRVVDETVQSTETYETYTLPRLRPELPATVRPVYRDGARGELPVTWTLPPDSAWRRPGVVRVNGQATDPLGRTIPAKAVVTVDTFSASEPGRAKTYAGGVPTLPATVAGIGDHGGRAVLPVTWGELPAFDEAGVVEVNGAARLVDGTTVPAVARVQVTEPVPLNVARADGVSVGATFTEDGYSPAGLNNGDLADKAWSNWKPSDKNPSDTITYTLPAAQDVTRVATYFFRDGTNPSVAQSLRVQVRAADGSWTDASGEVAIPWNAGDPAPIVNVPLSVAATDGVRVVMTVRPSGYLTVSEIELYGKGPGESSDAAARSLEVDGVPVAGFDPDVTDYRVTVRDPRRADVTASPSDPYATVEIAGDGNRRRTVTVAAEDGSQTRTYRIELVRRS